MLRLRACSDRAVRKFLLGIFIGCGERPHTRPDGTIWRQYEGFTMRAKDEVSAALTGPAPCDGCDHRSACRDEKLACMDFQRWVNTGRMTQPARRDPTNKVYRIVFRGERAA